MRTSVTLLLAAVLVVGCGSSDPASPRDSGVSGLVLVGPNCPVVQADDPCADEPYAAEVRVLAAGGELVTTVQAGADGRFLVRLAPGRYVLEAVAPNAGGLPGGKPVDVVVEPHVFTHVTVRLDTGIR